MYMQNNKALNQAEIKQTTIFMLTLNIIIYVRSRDDTELTAHSFLHIMIALQFRNVLYKIGCTHTLHSSKANARDQSKGHFCRQRNRACTSDTTRSGGISTPNTCRCRPHRWPGTLPLRILLHHWHSHRPIQLLAA